MKRRKRKSSSRLRRIAKLRNLNYKNIRIADYALAIAVLSLTLFGILMVYDTSVVVAHEQFGDRFWFLKNQSIWAIFGIGAGFIVSGIDYRIWRKLATPIMIASLVMLVLIFIPGFSSEVYGARQRLVIPGGLPILQHIFVQPSELTKLALVIYLSHLFATFRENIKGKGQFVFPHIQFFVVTGLVALLIAVEPDLGNAILVSASAFVLYFAAGAHLLTVTGVLVLGALAALGYAFSSEYRRDRLITFLNPGNDPQNSSYQIMQILIALGSGGLFGLGLGNSRQKYQYIPEVTTDSIFAIIGEELGLIGALLVVAAIFFVIWRGYKIAFEAEDVFGRLLAIGLTTNIAVQAVVNLGGMVGLMPLTGVPLPFISYGGSSLTLLLVSVGMLLNISRSAKANN